MNDPCIKGFTCLLPTSKKFLFHKSLAYGHLAYGINWCFHYCALFPQASKPGFRFLNISHINYLKLKFLRCYGTLLYWNQKLLDRALSCSLQILTCGLYLNGRIVGHTKRSHEDHSVIQVTLHMIACNGGNIVQFLHLFTTFSSVMFQDLCIDCCGERFLDPLLHNRDIYGIACVRNNQKEVKRLIFWWLVIDGQSFDGLRIALFSLIS